jgi:ABC-type phosphate transport system substrate-binding protein
MKTNRIFFTIVCTFIFLGLHAQSNYKVIVNSSNSITSISKTELSNIFLKKVTKFSNSVTAVPIDQVENSSVRNEFTSSVLKKTVSAVKSYWNQQLFSGAGVPPNEVKTDMDVINYVKSTPGAIGYISANTAPNGVSVIIIQ